MAWEKVRFQCAFCGRQFVRSISSALTEVRCPTCREYDVEVLGLVASAPRSSASIALPGNRAARRSNADPGAATARTAPPASLDADPWRDDGGEA